MPVESQNSFANDGTQTTVMHQSMPQYCLRGISNQVKDQIFVLSTNTMFGRTIVGRSPDCSIVLNAPGVSRQHAAIQIKDGRVTLEDLGSSNGTYVDGVRVNHAHLAPGQEVIFESLRFVFEPLTSGSGSRPDEHQESTLLLRSEAPDRPGRDSSSSSKTWIVLLISALVIAIAIIAGAWIVTQN